MQLSTSLPTITTTLLLLLSQATTGQAWYWANHNLIQSFGAAAPAGLTINYQPLLLVQDGCVPFPAVDLVDGGRAGAGLGLGGAINGNCGSSTGQVYSRSGTFGGSFGIMYAWYFPKDQGYIAAVGHRHDWEAVTVWFTGSAVGSTLLAICPSRHGTGQEDNYCDKTGSFKLQGTRPKINYRPDGVTTHALFTTTSTSGLGSQPLIDWSVLPSGAKQILNEADFGSANVPLKDSVWAANMEAARLAAGI